MDEARKGEPVRDDSESIEAARRMTTLCTTKPSEMLEAGAGMEPAGPSDMDEARKGELPGTTANQSNRRVE